MSSELVPVPPEPAPPALPTADLVAAWLDGRKPSTVEAYSKCLRDFARHAGAASPGLAVEGLLCLDAPGANLVLLGYRNAQLAAGLSSATIAQRMAALRSVVKLARQLGRVTWAVEVQAPRAEPRRDMRGPDGDALKRVRKALKAAGSGPEARRDRAVFALLFGLGLRRLEVCGLDLADLDFVGGRVWVLGKGRREKMALALPPELARVVNEWVVVRGSDPGPLFVRLDRPGATGRLGVAAVNRLVARAGVAAGLASRLRPHGLRHAAITQLIGRKKTVAQVMSFSRHCKPETVMRYFDAAGDAQGEMARELSKDLG